MKSQNVSTGATYGVLIGLVYVLFLFWRWSSAENMIMFSIIAGLAYVVVLGMMFYEAFVRRKQNGGYIDLKNLFQTLFISVIIFEVIYAIYNFIHLKYIDPDVVANMKAGVESMLDKAGEMSDEDREKALKGFDEMDKATELGSVVKSFLISIAISGVFALIISLIMRRKKPVFEEVNS